VLPRDEPRLRIQRDRPGRLAFKSTLEEVHRHARSASSRCWAAFSLSTTPLKQGHRLRRGGRGRHPRHLPPRAPRGRHPSLLRAVGVRERAGVQRRGARLDPDARKAGEGTPGDGGPALAQERREGSLRGRGPDEIDHGKKQSKRRTESCGRPIEAWPPLVSSR
jgi:hypothetical protein